jgi:hypothetical protein
MLRIFRNIFKKKKRKKRKSTQQQKLDRIELRQRKYLEKVFEEMTEKDPELKRLIIAKTFNITLPDPSIGQRQEVDALINDLVIKEIQQDSELRKEMVSGRIFQFKQNVGLAPSNEELRNRPTPMQQMINSLEEFNRLKEAAGVKEPGFFRSLVTPELITAVFQTIRELLPGTKPPANIKDTIILVQNGEEREITRTEYERLKWELHQHQNSRVKEGDTNENKNTEKSDNQEVPESDGTDEHDQTNDAPGS